MHKKGMTSHVKLLSDPLRQQMEERQYCSQAEIPKELLLKRLAAIGELSLLVETWAVHKQITTPLVSAPLVRMERLQSELTSRAITREEFTKQSDALSTNSSTKQTNDSRKQYSEVSGKLAEGNEELQKKKNSKKTKATFKDSEETPKKRKKAKDQKQLTSSYKDIPKQLLLQRLAAFGELDLVDIWDVEVQMLSCASLTVTMDSSTGGLVAALKRAIASATGSAPALQELLLLDEQTPTGAVVTRVTKSDASGVLQDSDRIDGPCSVLLSLKIKTGLDFVCDQNTIDYIYLCCSLFCTQYMYR
jgi:hypothetical protein